MVKKILDKDRRNALKMIVGAVATVPVASLLATRQGYAAELPHVSEDDATAKALKYVHDATKAARTDKGGTPGDQQVCANCNFFQGDSGEWRPCQLFPGKAVNENGWCMSWVLKMS